MSYLLECHGILVCTHRVIKVLQIAVAKQHMPHAAVLCDVIHAREGHARSRSCTCCADPDGSLPQLACLPAQCCAASRPLSQRGGEPFHGWALSAADMRQKVSGPVSFHCSERFQRQAGDRKLACRETSPRGDLGGLSSSGVRSALSCIQRPCLSLGVSKQQCWTVGWACWLAADHLRICQLLAS